MHWEDIEKPQHYTGPSTSISTLAGAIDPPETAKNSTVQNHSHCPSPLGLYGWVSSEDHQRPEHYAGPSTSISALAGAIELLPAANNATVQTQNQFSSCPSQRCLYIRDGSECGESITCSTAPEHFSAMHGIKDMMRSTKIVCKWQDCGYEVLRHNFVRHIRESHMGHKRRAGR